MREGQGTSHIVLFPLRPKQAYVVPYTLISGFAEEVGGFISVNLLTRAPAISVKNV